MNDDILNIHTTKWRYYEKGMTQRLWKRTPQQQLHQRLQTKQYKEKHETKNSLKLYYLHNYYLSHHNVRYLLIRDPHNHDDVYDGSRVYNHWVMVVVHDKLHVKYFDFHL